MPLSGRRKTMDIAIKTVYTLAIFALLATAALRRKQ